MPKRLITLVLFCVLSANVWRNARTIEHVHLVGGLFQQHLFDLARCTKPN
jgi:hypothetical protein